MNGRIHVILFSDVNIHRRKCDIEKVLVEFKDAQKFLSFLLTFAYKLKGRNWMRRRRKERV